MFKVLKHITIAALLFFTYLLFVPRNYNVEAFQKSPEINYWELDNGNKIGYCLLKGKNGDKKKPIVYLHGGPSGFITGNIKKSLLPLAEIGYDIYLYDQIGSGHSDRLENINEYSVERHVSDLKEISNKIGTEKIILLGHSWGAILATIFASENKNKIDKIILTGPGPVLPINKSLFKLKPPDSLNIKPSAFSNKEANKKANNIRTKLALYVAYIFGKKLMPDQEADNFFTFLNNELNKSTVRDPSKLKKAEGGGGYYAHIMTVKSFSEVKDYRNQLKKMGIPVLILRGQYDNQPWGYANEYVELLPDAQLKIIENAGHSIYKDQPSTYLSFLKEFLNKP